MVGGTLSRLDVVRIIREALAEGKRVFVAIPGCVGDVVGEIEDRGWFRVRTPKCVVAWPVFEDVPMVVEDRGTQVTVRWAGWMNEDEKTVVGVEENRT